MFEFWNRLGRGARLGLAGGATAIVLMTVVLGWWLLHPNYQVLFSDLKPQDAAAMTAELDRLKIPYRFSDSGNALMSSAIWTLNAVVDPVLLKVTR